MGGSESRQEREAEAERVWVMEPGEAKVGAEAAPQLKGLLSQQSCSLDADIKKAIPPEKSCAPSPSPRVPTIISGSLFLQPEQPKLSPGLLHQPPGWKGEASPSHGINCRMIPVSHSASPRLSFPIWKLGRPIPVSPYPPAKHDVGRGRGCANKMRSQIGNHTETQHPITRDSSFMTSPA